MSPCLGNVKNKLYKYHDTPEFQISMLEAYIGAMEQGRPPSQIEQMRQEMEEVGQHREWWLLVQLLWLSEMRQHAK